MGALTFGLAGFSLAIYSNLARKLPMFRRPWEHLLYLGGGMVVGTQVDKFRDQMQTEVDEIKAKRAKDAADRQARLDAWRATQGSSSAVEAAQS